MPWCSIRITYAPTGYGQNYKRNLAAHNHQAQGIFVLAALQDSLARVNAQRPPNAQVQQNQLGQNNLAVQMQNDPGPTYRLI